MDVERWVTWNSLILKYLEQGRSDEAVAMIEEMCLEEGDSVPSESLIVAALNRLGSSRMLEAGRRIHCVAGGLNLLTEARKREKVGRALVEMYVRCGSLEDAGKLFDSMPAERTGEWWTLMIHAYVKRGWINEALLCFRRSLLDGVQPGDATLVAVLSTCSRRPAFLRILHEMVEETGSIEKLAVPLVKAYAKLGSLDEAWKVMEKIESQDVELWKVMVATLSRVEELLKKMDLDLQGDRSKGTIVSLLRACKDPQNRQVGRAVHGLVLGAGLESDASVGSSLVEMYVSWGEMEQAQEVFSRIKVRHISLWNRLLEAYTSSRKDKSLAKLYREYLLEGFKADEASPSQERW